MIIYLVYFIVGFIWRQVPMTDKEFYKKLNKFIIYLPLPAITMTKIPDLDVLNNLEHTLPPIIAAWGQLLLSVLLMVGIGKWLRWSRSTIGAMALVCGLGNTSFIGFPLVESYFGADALKYAIIVDQGGSFLCLSVGGIIVASIFSSGKIDSKKLIRNLIGFPPFLFFLLAIINPMDILHNEWYLQNIFPILVNISKLMVPLAIISIGMQFKLSLDGVDRKAFGIGLCYKLVLYPLLTFLVLHILLGRTDIQNDITVFEMAMPPMITASIVALNYDLEPKLANALVTLGIVVAMPTLYIWNMILTNWY